MDYETEEQQVEALKQWWAENGRSVMLGVGIGIAAIGGWQFWGKHQESQARAASDGYEQTIQALTDGGDAPTLAAKVKKKHKNSLYATYAALAAARAFVEKNDLAGAEKELSWAVSHSPVEEMALTARIRLARVQGALGRHEEALKTLPGKAPEAFTALIEEARGDLYVATGDHDKARKAYQTALDSNQAGGDRTAITMKLNELATSDAADAS